MKPTIYKVSLDKDTLEISEQITKQFAYPKQYKGWKKKVLIWIINRYFKRT